MHNPIVQYSPQKCAKVFAALSLSLITVIAVIVLDGTDPAPADPFGGLHLSASADTFGAPITSYESESFSYTVRFPSMWTIDDSRSELASDILSDPTEHVVITISETENTLAMTEEGREFVALSIGESIKLNPAFAIEQFERLNWKGRFTIFTDGLRKVGGENWRTREYNVIRPNHGGILNISISTPVNAVEEFEEVLEEILGSLEV